MGAVDLAVAFVGARPACRRVERDAQHNPRPYARPDRSAHTPHRRSTHAASRVHHSKPAPEARHNLAHRGSGGKTRKKYPERRFTLRACLWQGRAGGATHASHHNIREPPNPHPRMQPAVGGPARRRQARVRHAQKLNVHLSDLEMCATPVRQDRPCHEGQIVPSTKIGRTRLLLAGPPTLQAGSVESRCCNSRYNLGLLSYYPVPNERAMAKYRFPSFRS